MFIYVYIFISDIDLEVYLYIYDTEVYIYVARTFVYDMILPLCPGRPWEAPGRPQDPYTRTKTQKSHKSQKVIKKS